MSEDRVRDSALVLVAHGDRGDSRRNGWLLAHADALKDQTGFRVVAAGVLKGEPSLEEALADVARSEARRVLVYPVCMSNGYFVGTVLGGRVSAAACSLPVTILSPLGLDPRLPPLFLGRSLAAARASGFESRSTRLVVVGHGSKLGPASAHATEKMAEKLRRARRFSEVELAFLEEPPFLQDALTSNPGPTVVAGFFSGEGMHARGDVPAAIEETGANATYTGAIGVHRRIPRLIQSAVSDQLLSGG